MMIGIRSRHHRRYAMPTAYSYVRFSSDQQKHGASLERQKSMVAEWLQKNPEYTLSDVTYEDLGISGHNGDHLDNAFGRLLAGIESGAIAPGSMIVIEAIDRAGRLHPDMMLNIFTSITIAGVQITTLDDGVVYSSDTNKSNNLFLLVAKVQQAWSYSDNLSRRVRDAYQRKREKAAQGITTKRRTPAWLTSDGEVIPEVARFVVQAFEDYATGLGERRIHRRIYEHIECPEALKNLSPGTVKKWFNNKLLLATGVRFRGFTPQ